MRDSSLAPLGRCALLGAGLRLALEAFLGRLDACKLGACPRRLLLGGRHRRPRLLKQRIHRAHLIEVVLRKLERRHLLLLGLCLGIGRRRHGGARGLGELPRVQQLLLVQLVLQLVQLVLVLLLLLRERLP